MQTRIAFQIFENKNILQQLQGNPFPFTSTHSLLLWEIAPSSAGTTAFCMIQIILIGQEIAV